MQQPVNKRMILKVLMVFHARYCSQPSGIAECGNGPIKHWLQKLSASPSPCPGHTVQADWSQIWLSMEMDHLFLTTSWKMTIIIRAKWGRYIGIFWNFWNMGHYWVWWIFLISKSNSGQEMVRHCNKTSSRSGNDKMTLRELSEETLAGCDVFLDAIMSGRDERKLWKERRC